ncbi:MAG: PKD domain-containing protein [Candidatus Methanomethyliaceae archaeon]
MLKIWLNKPPVPLIMADPTEGYAPLEVIFDASRSFDPEGEEIVAFDWELENNIIKHGIRITHVFPEPGDYTVKLTVRDKTGASGSAIGHIAVHAPETLVVSKRVDAVTETIIDVSEEVRVVVPPLPVPLVLSVAVGKPGPSSTSDVEKIVTIRIAENMSSQNTLSFKTSSPGYYLMKYEVTVPPEMNYDTTVLTMLTKDGWAVVPTFDANGEACGLGGLKTGDRKVVCFIPIALDMQNAGSTEPILTRPVLSIGEALKLCLKDLIKEIRNKFDVSPICPTVSESSCQGSSKKVSIRNDDRGFGGVWFELKLQGTDILAAPPAWERPVGLNIPKLAICKATESLKLGWLVPPSGNPGNLVVVFRPSNGEVLVTLDALSPLSFPAQVASWLLKFIPAESKLAQVGVEFTAEFFLTMLRDIQLDLGGESFKKGLEIAWVLAKKFGSENFAQSWVEYLLESGGCEFTRSEVLDLSLEMASKITLVLSLMELIGNIITWDTTLFHSGGMYKYPIKSCGFGENSTVTLTLYVHEGSATGPVIAGAKVQGQDGGGNTFDQTTNDSGYVALTGVAGTWQFTVSKSGYKTNSWSQAITETCTKHAYLEREASGGPPKITSFAVSNVQATSITLKATVKPNGLATTVYFEWGFTTSYGNHTDERNIGAGTTDVEVTANLTGLTPDTLYHWRVVATNKLGSAWTPDLTFKTALPVPSFDFDMSINPTSYTARQNDMTSITVRAWRTAGALTSVSFSVTGLPSGIIANPSSWSWDLGDQSRAVVFSVSPNVSAGTYTITIIGTGGGKTKTATFCIIVTGRFKPGDPVYVYGTGGVGLRVRDAPCGNRIGNEPDTATGTVLEGPVVCVLDGKAYKWWKIRWSDGLIGWSVEDYLALALG